MQRFEKVAEALEALPTSIWAEPESRSWSPSRQVECIDALKYGRERLQKLIEATSTLVEHGYPLMQSFSDHGSSINAVRNVRHEPTLNFTINNGLLEKIEQYMVLDPNVEHEAGINILCIMEAASEYLSNRIAEESKFLDHITEEIST